MTSRRRLTGLPRTVGIALDPLTTSDGLDLLDTAVGDGRVAAEPDAARELVEACGGLPLALRIVSGRLAARPQWSLARMRRLLDDERHRLDELTTGDLEVRTSLTASYANLDDEGRTAFRRLGLLNVPDFAPWVLAALLDTDLRTAEHVLETAGTPQDGERYRLHDLLAVFARAETGAQIEPRDVAWVAEATGLDPARRLADRHPIDPAQGTPTSPARNCESPTGCG